MTGEHLLWWSLGASRCFQGFLGALSLCKVSFPLLLSTVLLTVLLAILFIIALVTAVIITWNTDVGAPIESSFIVPLQLVDLAGTSVWCHSLGEDQRTNAGGAVPYSGSHHVQSAPEEVPDLEEVRIREQDKYHSRV